MRLSHLLVMIAPTVPVAFVLAWIEGLVGIPLSFEVRYWIAAPIAVTVAVFAAWPLARLFRVPPMMVLSGPCPACVRRPPGWLADPRTRDPLQLACGLCGERVELWLETAPGPRAVGGPRRFCLRSPKFLGRWRPID